MVGQPASWQWPVAAVRRRRDFEIVQLLVLSRRTHRPPYQSCQALERVGVSLLEVSRPSLQREVVVVADLTMARGMTHYLALGKGRSS